jgi:hypothetical protein
MTAAPSPLRPVPIQVRDTRGHWHHGFQLLAFNADGTVTVRSQKTGVVRSLPQSDWRDPVEQQILNALP